MSPFRRFLVAILALGLAYGAYALLIAPLLEPPPLSLTEGGGTPGVYVATAQLRDFSWLFVEGSWELDNPKVVETAQCTLLLKDYKPLPDGRMELNPCTLIFYMAEDADAKNGGLSSGNQRRPVVLRAPQGAVLQFDRPLDFSRAEFGTLIGGRLNGEIQIFSPPTVVGGNDALNITTRNVQIDRQKVYTPHEVVFDYGSSFGRGRDLTINLLPKNEEDAGSDHSPSLGGISYLQLAHVERLHLEGAGGMLAGPAGKTPGSSSSAPKDPPLEVHCTGPLVVDFEKRRAALDENVEISRVYPQGPADRLTCDRLIFLLVDSKPGKKPTTTASSDPKVPPPDRLSEQVKQIVALGNPVVLDAPQTATYARAGRVDYFTAEKTIKLQGGERQVPVSLKHQEHRFDAREIEYVMAPEGRLGRLWAAGPGELEFVQGDAQKKQTIQASWRKTLLVRPQEKYQVISLTQGARVAADGMGEFQAQELHFWVQEVPRQPVGSSVPVASPKGVAAASSKSPQAKFDIIPDRLLALGQVRIDSPQLKAKTNRLEAWFGEKLEVAATTTVPVEDQDEVAVTPALPNNSLAGDGNPEVGPPLADEQTPPPAAVQKLDVSGDLIQLQFLRVGTKPTIEDLAITGRVEVEEIQTQKPDEVPLKLSGDAVTLVRASGMNAKLEVTGKPARVSARGLSLAGGKIHLHRGENRVWIDGPGEATLPMPAEDLQNRSITAPSDIPALESLDGVDPKKVNVSWTGAMNFDGLTVSFETGVKVRGDGLTANARTMSVTLSQRIDFAAPRQEEPVEVARLALNGDGEMVSVQQIGRDKLTGDQSSLDNLLVRNLVIDRQQGTLKAEGPGEVWTVRRDEAGLPGSELVPGTTAKTNGKLTYVCVKFEGGIVGNMERHEIKFERQVETTYGQVTDWKDRIIAKRLEDLGESGALVHSDTLTITEMAISKTQKWVELDARGNTLVEGKAFTARAARIGYTSDKDQLILEGDGRSDAELWHQPSPGAQHSYTAAGKIRYHRKSNSLEVDDAKILDLGSLPAGNKPVPVRR